MKIRLLYSYQSFKKGDIFEVSKEYVTFIDKEKAPWTINNTKGSIKAFEFIEEENGSMLRNMYESMKMTNNALRDTGVKLEQKIAKDEIDYENIKTLYQHERREHEKTSQGNTQIIIDLQDEARLLKEEFESLKGQNEMIKKANEDLNKLKSESEDWIIKLRSEVSCLKFSGENNLIKDLIKLIEVSK